MEYLFILGRNLKLSKEEIKSYFKKNNLNFNILDEEKNSLLVETNSELGEDTILRLGGIISIGKVLAKGGVDIIKKELEKIDLFNISKNKLNYVLWDFSTEESIENISKYLKIRLKREKIKGTEKKLFGNLKSQGEKDYSIVSGKNIEKEYFLFGQGNKNYFGEIIQKSDYQEISSRDMEKPIRREELAISPRMAKIMINLSEAKKGDKVIDAFCGIGVILIEALNQEMEVIGVDKDSNAIEGAKKNLNWFKFKARSYLLINENSSKVNIPKVKSMISEPWLGEILKKTPTKEETTKILKNYEKLMISVLNNLKNKVENKFVFTAPFIKINKKRFGINIQRILDKTGLFLEEDFPIGEFRKNQIVGREIFVLKHFGSFKN